MKTRSTILIVDDDPSMRGLLRRGLEDDYDVIEAENARHALELALRDLPACVLLDLTLPGFSGLEMCRILSSLQFTQRIPVVILSGQPALQYRDLCLRHGAREYFEKPVGFEQLKARLEALISEGSKERRSHPRAPLNLPVKLRGADSTGSPFEALTTTENVSPGGFTCNCTVPLLEARLVEVFLESPREHLVGLARVARREWTEKLCEKYALVFVDPCQVSEFSAPPAAA